MYVLVELLAVVALLAAFVIFYLNMYYNANDVCYYEVEDGITAATTVSVCSIIIDALLLLFTNVIKQFKEHFVSALILCIILLVLLVCLILLLWKKLDMGKMQKMIQYKKKLLEIENKIRNTKIAIKNVKNDDEIEEDKKRETLILLKETRRALKVSYSDLKLALHMLQVGNTISELNGMDETIQREELQHQIDIMASKKKLDVSLEDKYKGV